ncbi:hypothetical protein BSKO_09673 [Bryopsis sp. KO-2023]|nr:hypothetical protein BSKO_09673 [Bryopsis sp. KO-2023]
MAVEPEQIAPIDESAPDEETGMQLTIVWLLLIVTVCITYLLQRSGFSRICPPSAVAMFLGIIVGVVVIRSDHLNPPEFSAEAFLYGLLPPIVFGAGFSMKKKKFFHNFGAIILFAVLGTVISTIVFSLFTLMLVGMGAIKEENIGKNPAIKSFMYGSLIAAIDPVATLSVFSEMDAPPLLYNLVFGESVLNDAVAVVLFRTFEGFLGTEITFTTIFWVIGKFFYISLGSLGVGILVALICAFILKRFNPSGGDQSDGGHFDGTIYEISIVLMGAYMAYLVAESLELSGIVAIFFSGMCIAHYSYHNITIDAQITMKKLVDVVVFLAETFVFEYLGLQVALIKRSSVDIGLIVSGIPLCIVARAANIFPLAYLANRFRRFPIPFRVQTMQWACGLRGAVAYALAAYMAKLPKAQPAEALETATLIVVVVSTIGFGGGTGPLMKWLKLQGADDTDIANMGYDELASGQGSPSELRRMHQQEHEEVSALQARWDQFDNKYMKRYFGGQTTSRNNLLMPGNSMAISDGELQMDSLSRKDSD